MSRYDEWPHVDDGYGHCAVCHPAIEENDHPDGGCNALGESWPCAAQRVLEERDRLREAAEEVLAATGERPPEGPEPTTAEVERWYITNDGRIIRALAALRNLLHHPYQEEE